MKKILIHSCTECPFTGTRITKIFCKINTSEITEQFISKTIAKNCPLEDN